VGVTGRDRVPREGVTVEPPFGQMQETAIGDDTGRGAGRDGTVQEGTRRK
jgi:hypothetical protein